LVGLLAFVLAYFRIENMKKTKRVYKHWTKHDDETLTEFRLLKVSVRNIAKFMDRTESSIHNRIYLLKAVNVRRKAKPEQKKSWFRWLMGSH
tara:strand:+ start:394 stop:669 length:276 start_codon:yes stop_codon:yes gene_type:complete